MREQIRNQVLAGELAPGTSCRPYARLADDLGLATNTVARAYRELEALGVIETRGPGRQRGHRRWRRPGRPGGGPRVRRDPEALGLGSDEALDLVRRAFA